MSNIIKFKGISITKESLEEKYDIQLTEVEFKVLASIAEKSYIEHSDEYRLLIFKHLKKGLNEIGYKPVLDGMDIKFKKV